MKNTNMNSMLKTSSSDVKEDRSKRVNKKTQMLSPERRFSGE